MKTTSANFFRVKWIENAQEWKQFKLLGLRETVAERKENVRSERSKWKGKGKEGSVNRGEQTNRRFLENIAHVFAYAIEQTSWSPRVLRSRAFEYHYFLTTCYAMHIHDDEIQVDEQLFIWTFQDRMETGKRYRSSGQSHFFFSLSVSFLRIVGAIMNRRNDIARFGIASFGTSYTFS